MIPKIIHFCWFGGNEKPELAKKCMKSWREKCPDFEIVEWNENNYDLEKTPLYVQQAYKAKKWAFVTDYVRLQVVYDNGGVYLDTDVEIVGNLESLLKYSSYFGFEGNEFINTGLGFGAEKHSKIVKEIMSDYENISFILEDGTYDLTPCPVRNTKVLEKHGLLSNGKFQILDQSIAILPSLYLCPLDNATRVLSVTIDTVSIHHFNASWQTKEQIQEHDRLVKQRRRRLLIEKVLYAPRKFARFLIGDDAYEKIKRVVKHG